MSDRKLPWGLENLLVVAAVGFFAAGLCFTEPSLFKSTDYVLFYKANFQFLSDAVSEGRIPLWNPYVGLGRPYLADSQNAVFYPPVYLVCLGPRIGVFLLVWLHCGLGVFGMRRFGETLSVGRWQGYFLAFSFLASGALMARWLTGQILYCCALCYLPWLLHYGARTDEGWQARRVARHAILLALQFLCGHPQVFWFSVIGQGAFIIGRAVRRPVRDAAWEACRALAQLGAACIWCAGLVAVVLLPFMELARQGNRAVPSPEFVAYGELSWVHLGSLLTPLGISDIPIDWEKNVFVGPVLLGLGLMGLARVQERNVRGLLAVLAAALLMALGDNTPLFPLLYKCLPGFAGFRLHARAGSLLVLALACAAGVWLSRSHPKLKAAWNDHFDLPLRFVVGGIVLLHLASAVAGALQMRDTYTFETIMRSSPDFPFQARLIEQMNEARLLKPSLAPPRVCVPYWLVPANYAMIYRYSSFDAYTSLFLRRPWDYLHAARRLQPPALKNTSVAVEVYEHGPFPYPDLALAIGSDMEGTLQLATDPAPRAFLVYAAEVVGSYQSVLARLREGYDIRHSALLECPLAPSLPLKSSWPRTAVPIRRFDPNSLVLDVDARTNALLVLAEAWYPGWKAQVNGKTERSVPANLWMRAVPVPQGRTEVRVFFQQNYLWTGAVLSFVSSVFGLLALTSGRAQALVAASSTAPPNKQQRGCG
jgi:hypothetical protein